MKKFLPTLVLFLCLQNMAAQNCSSLRYKQEIFSSVDITTGIVYGNADPYGILSSQDLIIDVYEPAGDTLTKRPVIVYAYGGAFLIGTNNQPPIPYYADFYAKHGYVFVSISYRLGLNLTRPGSPERAVYRAAQDLRAAERHLIQRASQYRIDTSKIILMGSSAGSITDFHSTYLEYAQAAAYATPIPILDGEILGGVDSSGNNDFRNGYVEPFAIINQWGAIADTGWIDADERTPVISFHGDGDNAVHYEYGYPFSYPVFPALYGSKPIHERLNNLGIHNELHTLVGFGHEPELLNLALRDTILQGSRDFIYPLLQPNTSAITGVANVCAGTAVTYSITNTAGSEYCWTINGNGTITADSNNSITVIWNDSGTVSVSVKELNYIAAEGEERNFQTRVVPHAESSFSFTANELTVSFVNLSSGATSYQWNFDDGMVSFDLNPSPEVYESGGTFTITLIAANEVCADTSWQTISIDSCPVASITYQLNNQNAFFYTPNTNTISYSWNFGDGDSASVNFSNVFHQYPVNGQYTIILKVRNALGCEDVDTATIVVAVTSVNELSADAIICNGEGCRLQVTGLTGFLLEVFDMTGRKITHQQLNANCQLPIINYSQGIYLLRISNGEKVILKKFMVR